MYTTLYDCKTTPFSPPEAIMAEMERVKRILADEPEMLERKLKDLEDDLEFSIEIRSMKVEKG